MQLSKRLLAVADMVTPGNRLADVGTDHGYVPIWLYEEGRIPSAIAMDLREGPLARAEEHIREHGCEQVLATRLSDGLQKLLPGEADSVVIAGMGGMLMQRILREGQALLPSLRELILQPQSDLEAVRRYLRETGFCIVREDMVLEDGKYYPVIKAVPGETEDGPRIWYRYGRLLLENRHPVLQQFLQKEYATCNTLLEQLKNAGTVVARQRYTELLEEKQLIEEALACYQEEK
jgi:tRNA (adenine22-N1)-methyltransferase